MFKRYKSKPIVRLAYQIKAVDEIFVDRGDSPVHRINVDGEKLTFVAHEDVKVGDYIVYLNEDDIYHCSAKVFAERNVVE